MSIIALKSMLVARQASQDAPLFLLQSNTQWVALADSRTRKHLKQVSQIVHLPKMVTFHDFRRGVLLGLLSKVFPLNRSRCRVPGSPPAFGDTSRFHLLLPHRCPPLSNNTLLLSLLLLGIWGLVFL